MPTREGRPTAESASAPGTASASGSAASSATRLDGGTPPADKPWAISEDGQAAVDRMLAPYLEDAKATYPAARARFLAGLPSGHVFYVSVRLTDGSDGYEQVFLRVVELTGDTVVGLIANDLLHLRGFSRGQRVEVPEAEVLDWLITRPDGTEEGNVVGRFMDWCRPGVRHAVVYGFVADAQGRATAVRYVGVPNPDRGGSTRMLPFDPPRAYLESAERSIREGVWRGAPPGEERFTYFVLECADPTRVVESPGTGQ